MKKISTKFSNIIHCCSIWSYFKAESETKPLLEKFRNLTYLVNKSQASEIKRNFNSFRCHSQYEVKLG